MGGWRTAIYALLVVLFLAGADWGLRTRDNAGTQDTDLVYCLVPAHLGGLVNAGEALGVVGSGSSPTAILAGGQKLSLAQWRAVDGGDFQRTCTAYATANMPAQVAGVGPSDNVEAVLAILLPVIAGGLIALAADDVRRASDRRWANIGQLRADWQAFETAVNSFVADSTRVVGGSQPSDEDLSAKRRALQASLGKMPSAYRKSLSIKALQDDLADDGLLGPSIKTGWDGDASGKQVRAKQITDRLSNCRVSLESVAGALERRLWLPSKP
jgi:hypothetical protein